MYPVRIHLLHVHFRDNDAIPDEACFAYAAEPDLYEQVYVARPSATELSVAIEILSGEEAPIDVRVTYAADFNIHPNVPPDEIQEALVHTAYYLAPRAIYPYLREFVSNLTSRWRGGEIILPHFPLPLQLPEGEELTIPDPPEGAAEVYGQTEIPLDDGEEESDE